MQWSDSAATVSAAFAQRKRKMSSVETLACFCCRKLFHLLHVCACSYCRNQPVGPLSEFLP